MGVKFNFVTKGTFRKVDDPNAFVRYLSVDYRGRQFKLFPQGSNVGKRAQFDGEWSFEHELEHVIGLVILCRIRYMKGADDSWVEVRPNLNRMRFVDGQTYTLFIHSTKDLEVTARFESDWFPLLGPPVIRIAGG